MNKNQKELLRTLEERDGYICHYCGIPKDEFLDIWGKFYGLPYRGKRLEIEHKNAVVKEKGKIVKKNHKECGDNPEDCILACALCNMAKSNMFTYEEFKKVGNVIAEIWQKRQREHTTVEEYSI